MQGVRFDSKPSQDREKDKKRQKKVKKKLCSERDLNPRPSGVVPGSKGVVRSGIGVGEVGVARFGVGG